jgi:hypothetical protein
MYISSRIFAAALMAATAPWLAAPATAAPIASPMGLHNSVTPLVESAQYRRGFRRGYRGGGFRGPVLGLGLAAGAIIGGAIVGATQPYGNGYYGYSGYDPGYDEGYVAVSPYAVGGEAAYCLRRFRSYDPRLGTYVGFDGYRHPCP